MTQYLLSNIFISIRNGMNVKQSKDGDGLPITRIETISNGEIDAGRFGYAALSESACCDWLLEPGDILFSHINSPIHVGKCALYFGEPAKLVHGMNLLCLRADQSRLYPPFAKYLLRTPGFRAKLEPFINKAVNQASVSIRNLQNIEVEIPPLPEQKRIAAILDQADTVRQKRESSVKTLCKLKQSVFDRMFGSTKSTSDIWPTVTLADIVRVDDRINYGVVQPGSESEFGVPLVRVSNVVEQDFSPMSLKKIAPEIEAQYKRSRLHGDEILVACVGSIGAVALATDELCGANIARAVARIRVDTAKVDRAYVAEFLQLDRTQRYFRNETRAVAQPTLNIKQLSETPFFLPSLKAQREFSDIVRAFDYTMYGYRLHLSRLDSLFASLQHRAFSGELTSKQAERELAEAR